MIKNFRREYFFLSNFYEAPVSYRGLTYKNNEAAFQAQKTLDEGQRMKFQKYSGAKAKQEGRRLILRPDWEQIKYQVMKEICLCKFIQNYGLLVQLLKTGAEIIQEENTWGDTTWGTVNGVGENHLGKILMNLRDIVFAEYKEILYYSEK